MEEQIKPPRKRSTARTLVIGDPGGSTSASEEAEENKDLFGSVLVPRRNRSLRPATETVSIIDNHWTSKTIPFSDKLTYIKFTTSAFMSRYWLFLLFFIIFFSSQLLERY